MTVDGHDPVGVYFGTTSGEVWASRDEGASWAPVLQHLPEIYSVEAATPTRTPDRRVRWCSSRRRGSPMKVRIPTPLRSYTGQRAVVDGEGRTVAEVLDDLDRRYPGIRFRVVDEQGRLRKHMKVFVAEESVRDLATSVDGRRRARHHAGALRRRIAPHPGARTGQPALRRNHTVSVQSSKACAPGSARMRSSRRAKKRSVSSAAVTPRAPGSNSPRTSADSEKARTNVA